MPNLHFLDTDCSSRPSPPLQSILKYEMTECEKRTCVGVLLGCCCLFGILLILRIKQRSGGTRDTQARRPLPQPGNGNGDPEKCEPYSPFGNNIFFSAFSPIILTGPATAI